MLDPFRCFSDQNRPEGKWEDTIRVKTERKGSVSESVDLKGDKKWFKLIVGHEMLGELRKM